MQQSELVLRDMYAEEISYKYEKIERAKEKVTIDNDFEIQVGKQDDKNFAIKIIYVVKKQKDLPYNIKVVYIGEFEYHGEEKDGIDKYLDNAVAILFPYLRTLISSLTMIAGVRPLVLPILNVQKNNN